jgi:EAL domain-containing protein (putative c-di-GMP-specific phosphodiesterase class I)/GGDEF domain-containing protein
LAIEASRKEGTQIALSKLLVVGFAEINETLGMNESDAALKSVAARLSELTALDSNAIAARLIGAEFAILRRGKTAAIYTDEFAGIMMRSLAQPILVGQVALMTEPCIGTALLAPGELGELSADAAAAELMKRAAIALSAANKTGPGTHRRYDEDLDHRRQHRMLIRHSMRDAIDNDQFELHYQPLVDLQSSTIVSAEALIRWQHPQLGLLRPDLFIALAEESGLIGPLGEWVMRTAMRQMMAWESEGLDPPTIALNISSVQVKMPDFTVSVRRALAETGADARRFDLELTEGILLELSPAILAVLSELKLLGFKLVIDDFGAGHSSLQYLRNFPIDKLKIDRIFVRQLVADSSDAMIIRAITSLAHSLKIGLVAEGIETVEQRDFLSGQGCTTGQGYYFSLPLAAEDFAWMIKQKTVLPMVSAKKEMAIVGKTLRPA